MRKSILFTIVILIFAFFCATLDSKASAKQQGKKDSAPKEQPRKGGTLIFALGKEPGNPNPFIQTSSTTQFVRDASYESLLTRDYKDKIVPNLAEAYEISSGGTVFTLHLRRGVKFHNGKEMKADDVLWSVNHVKDPKNGAFGNKMISDVASVEKLGDYVVKFTLSKPSMTFLSYLTNIRMLTIVPANSLQPGQIKLAKNTFVPGTGPFILDQFQPGFDTVLKRFPAYWGGPAYLDKIIFRPISDEANRFNALRTGDVHMADRLTVLDVARIKKGDVKKLKILEEPLGGFQHLIVNYLNPLFHKLEMRQALLYATDKQRLVDEVYFSAAIKADLMMDPNGKWAKEANIPPHKRNVVKAKELLKTAGYAGQELIFPGRKSERALLDSYQKMLGEAGIKVKIEILEAGVMRERVALGKYDLYIAGADSTADPMTTMIPHYYTNKVQKGRYSNRSVDKLFDSLDKESDENKRLQIFKELAWILENDVADIPLLFEIRYVGMTEKVQGYGPPPGYRYSESGEYFKHVWLK